MEAYRAVIMKAFRDRFTEAELLSYKEVLFEETTEEWYAQREMKLAIGDDMKILFKPIVDATKETAEEVREELAPMKGTLIDIALNRAAGAPKQPGPRVKNVNNTFGIYRIKDGN